MNKRPATFPNSEIPKIIPDTGVVYPKTDAEMNHIKNKNTDVAICQKRRKKDVYETYMYNIYNIIVGQTNKKIQEKSESGYTLQAVKKG